jgi:cell division protein FtsL
MAAVLIVILAAALLYVATRWHSAREEVAQLRAHVAALKRQLARRP